MYFSLSPCQTHSPRAFILVRIVIRIQIRNSERIAVDVFIRLNFRTLNRASVNAAYVYSGQRFPLRISDPDQDSDKCDRDENLPAFAGIPAIPLISL